jgi:RsiW-degrading membrane proteinase PrsW (M82 family)
VALHPELVIVAAAVGPPLALGVLALRLLPASERSRLVALVALGWGAVVATWAASTVNGAALRAAARGLDDAAAHALVATLVGPLVEEVAKALGVVAAFAMAARRGAADAPPAPRTGAVVGALVGLGFAGGENVEYYTLAAVQAGWDGVARAVLVRGLVQAGNHALFTAVVGAAIASARPAPARRIAGALALAWALHAVWNLVLSDRITSVLCNAPLPGGACAPAPDALDLLVRVPLLEAAFLGPALLALRAVVRRV